MDIRKATDGDIPGILAVLKASLGETSSKKSEAVWRYKHELNPFGKSLVLLAVENDEIVGVRAFMRWKWQKGKKEFSAFRAVDTATHPDHQGKGIFKRLTLKALEIGEEEGNNFVFNTPNSQSRPGYLSMGWNVVDKIKVSVSPTNPFYWKFGKQKKIDIKNGILISQPNYLDVHNSEMSRTEKLFTPKSWEYLNWRYIHNPLQEYHVKATENFFLAGYVKSQGKLKEFRVSEAIKLPEVSPKVFQKTLREWCEKNGVHFISSTPISKLGLSITQNFKIGPVLTLRDLELSLQEKEYLLDLNSWAYSTGDLELF